MFQYDPTETDTAKLQQLFKVAKSVMKSRNDQVEEIMEEMEKEAKKTKRKGRTAYYIIYIIIFLLLLSLLLYLLLKKVSYLPQLCAHYKLVYVLLQNKRC